MPIINFKMDFQYSDEEIENACDILWGSVLEIDISVMNPDEKKRKARMFRKFKLDLLVKRAMC